MASSGETWHCQDGHGIARMDIAWPGWTWLGRDGHGVAGLDIVWLGWTWRFQDRPNKVRYRNLYRRVMRKLISFLDKEKYNM